MVATYVAPTPKAADPLQTLKPNQAQWATMKPNDRTQKLWSRVSPGVMPVQYAVPHSTMHTHYQWDEDKQDKPTFEHSLKKTEFTEINEAMARAKLLKIQ